MKYFQLRLSAMQFIESMIKAPEKEIVNSFIVACVPEIASVLEEGQSKKMASEMELLVYKECVTILEMILSMIQTEHCKYIKAGFHLGRMDA